MRNLRAQPQATAISGPPGGGEEEQAPTLPPLPARLCPPRKHGLPPDDMAGALASALNSVAAGGGGSEVPSRQVSLDAVAALLQLPQAFAGATPGGPAPPQLPTRPGQQRGQPPHPDRHRRGAQRESSPSPKRARTIGVQSPATPIGQMPQALLLSAPGGEVAAPNQLQGLGPGHGWQAAVLAQLLGTAASQPTPHSGGSAVLPGSTAPSSPRSPRQQAPMQGQQAVPGEPRTGGQGRAAAADPGEVQQQLLLDLLAAVPDSQRGLQAEGGPQAPGPDTPRSTGSDHKAAGTAAWLGSAESPVSGLLRPPGNQPPPGGQVPLLVSRNASPGPCDAGAVAGTSTTLAGLASDPAAAAVHRLWSSAVAAPMPPLPPPPPAAAAAAAVARAGLPMLPEQRQATFEHSGELPAPGHLAIVVRLPACPLACLLATLADPVWAAAAAAPGWRRWAEGTPWSCASPEISPAPPFRTHSRGAGLDDAAAAAPSLPAEHCRHAATAAAGRAAGMGTGGGGSCLQAWPAPAGRPLLRPGLILLCLLAAREPALHAPSCLALLCLPAGRPPAGLTAQS